VIVINVDKVVPRVTVVVTSEVEYSVEGVRTVAVELPHIPNVHWLERLLDLALF
jgi:hypothetical protein